MINSNELRLGNWVNSKIKGCTRIKDGNVQLMEEQLYYLFDVDDDWKRIDPIPITEEWLVKFEFRKYRNGYIITPSIGLDYGYVIEHYEWRGDWALGILYYDPARDCDIDEVYNFCGTGLKHVHQLQNLFHALTGDELL